MGQGGVQRLLSEANLKLAFDTSKYELHLKQQAALLVERRQHGRGAGGCTGQHVLLHHGWVACAAAHMYLHTSQAATLVEHRQHGGNEPGL